MCGINGIISPDNDFKKKIIKMNELIRHRGPDDEGYIFVNSDTGKFSQYSGNDSIDIIKERYKNIEESVLTDENIVFAARRLSIIDLSENGHMPMCESTGRCWIIFNGEIYNYIELREQLINKGYKFNSASDTEVILNSYLEWGTDCLNKFNGMWSFAIWDVKEKILFASRDRFGVKPFYYLYFDNYLAFSSEIKPLMYLLDDVYLIENKIPYFLIYGNRIYDNETYIKNLNSLEAGKYLIYKDGSVITKRYYEVKARTDSQQKNVEQLSSELVSLLEDSVKLRFRSDAKVGMCLSGGFDSSSIVSLSSKIIGKGINTFSAVWSDPDCDESRYIDIVNNIYGSVSNKVEPKAENFESAFKLISYYQEIPTEGPGLIPQWYVMKIAGNKVKVLLDGQGGDEVFGGYFHKQSYMHALIKDRKYRELFSDLGFFMGMMNKDVLHNIFNWVFPEFYNKYYRAYFSRRKKILNREFAGKINKSDLYFDIATSGKFKSYLNDLSYHFVSKLTIPTLLHYEDRSSMAHSLESRVPFLDYRLVEFGLNLPSDMLINKNESRPLFRKAMSSHLPDEIIKRKDKLGFPVPFTKWSRTVLKDYIRESLTDNANLNMYVDKIYLNDILKKHNNENADYGWEIWRMLSLDYFLNFIVNRKAIH